MLIFQLCSIENQASNALEFKHWMFEEEAQIMQITTSWEEKGQIKGRLEGQADTILRLLNRKLGNLSRETVNRIKSLESNQLDLLTENLLDFESCEDLQDWFNNL